MCDELPSQYSAANVIGITRSHPKQRPTVYFDDGSRFTQQYRRESNLGYKPPSSYFFFGNYDNTLLEPIYDEAADIADVNGMDAGWEHIHEKVAKLPQIQEAILGDTRMRPEPPPATVDRDPDATRLLEVKVGTGGAPSVHRSRDVLVPVTKVEAMALLIDIRSRGTMATQIETGEYVYPDAEPPEIRDHATGPTASTQAAEAKFDE